MMNAFFASDDLDAVVTAFEFDCFVVHLLALFSKCFAICLHLYAYLQKTVV